VTWEFSREPHGVVTYMVVLGPDQVLKEIRQVLKDQNFARIAADMTAEEVRRIIGRPGETLPFPNLRETVASWKYETGPNETWKFNVHYGPDGRVKRSSRERVGTPP